MENGAEYPVKLTPETTVQLVIADFNDRRTEINNRTSAQHLLVSLNITAAGAISGVVLTSDEPNRSLLLLLVPVCTALAMLWANHARTIKHIGKYIRDSVRPFVAEGKDSPLWRWELDHDTFEDDADEKGAEPSGWNAHKWLTFVIPVMLIFLGPPLFGAIYSFEPMVLDGDAGSIAGYALALIMIVYAATLLALALVPGDKPAPSRTSSGPR